MIIGSLNIRGGGNALKRRRISNIIKKGEADIFLIQESKLTDLNEALARSFWCGSDIGFSFSNSEGFSGGMICLWKVGNVEVISSFKGEGFLGIKVIWKDNAYYILNVYSSCLLAKKKELWENILRLKDSFTDGEWIIGGDFNSIRAIGERRGRSERVVSNEAVFFDKFIEDSGLIDIPCKGKKYSWYSGDGRAMSRIDRFLVSNVVVNRWGLVGQFIGCRDVSDHCPVWLVKDRENWGPKPFKFNNEWFSFKSFIPFVETEWKEMVVEGRGDFVLIEKLKRLKDRLKWWNEVVFGKIDLEVEECVKEVNKGDSYLEEVGEDSFMDTLNDRRGRIRGYG
ncbi:uncharacterized protein LOC131639291 [Vicia villosa]|uniref:uncharacterized protein LOC131639291 n=1 Tax=Vicia villosa TaxID=3911 RepID=UPI00273A8EF5|nr:uncharacterized protein LOC131639291 [Vicia villosa]